jgi:pimeloyl-ACP methyl ester carboxylesterase
MKKTLINVVNLDQRKELKEITAETLLMWGKYDTSTPYKDGLLMNKKIKNSGIVTFNTGHFPFLEEPYIFKKTIENYLGIGNN